MKEALQNWTVARGLAQGLLDHEIPAAVLSPGSRNTPLVLAIDALRDTMAVHSVLDERSAAFFALGLARASRRPVVLCCTSGSAGAHYLPAVIEAAQSNIPLLLLTADRPPELQGTCAPQTVPQIGFFSPHVRWSKHVSLTSLPGDEDAMRTLVHEAMAIAEGQHPGPVHLNIPFREPLWLPNQNATTSEAAAVEPKSPTKSRLEELELSQTLESIQNASCGAIVCGHRETLPREKDGAFESLITQLAERLDWPIIAEPGSGLRFGKHDRSRVIDYADLLLRSERFATDAAPDLVLHFGRPQLSNPILRWINQLAWERKLVFPIPGDYSAQFYRNGRVLRSHPLELCAALLEKIPERSSEQWFALWAKAERAVQASRATDASDPRAWEGQIAQTLVQSLPEKARLFVGNSMPVRDLNTYGGGRDTEIVVWGNRGANGIDGNIATFLGSASYEPERPHVALLGDLALLHDIGSLIQLANKAPNATIVVIDNGGGNIFSHLPIATHTEVFERRFLTPPDVNLSEVLSGLPIKYMDIQKFSELSTALQEAFAAPQLTVVRIGVDRHHNMTLHKRAIEKAINSLEALK